MTLTMLLLQAVEMADAFRADGKIWVVVAVLGVTLLGLFGYLFYTERRIARLEKEINSSK